MEVRKSTLKLALGAGCALAVLAAATTASAEQRTFSLASSRATDTIPEFARQAGIQIVAPADRLRGVNTRAIEGRYDTREALAMLVEGTGLRIASDDGRTVTLVAADPQSGSAAGGGAEVEALIVTAQKREEDIQDVPIAMSAFTQEALTTHQIAGGPDLMTQIPNFTFTKTNFSSYSIQIRGIGTQAISATVDPAVAVAFNNTPFIRNRFFEQEFYDLNRVEVLRGPQGTLYGRNATAGVVNLITARPTHSFEAKVSADVSNYSSTRLEGMINLPLVEDKVALRLAGAWTKREGYVTNGITGEQIDGRDLWSFRATLGFEPTDSVRAYLTYEHFEEDDDRLRSGKQLCKRDPTPTHFGTADLTEIGDDFGGGAFGIKSYTSQGCEMASLYAAESFEVPNGFALPYYGPLANLGLPVFPNKDPYLSTLQSRDLRVIESTVEPVYQAKTDTLHFQFEADLTGGLTLTSETGYNVDELFSFQDFNRFNTTPDVFDPAALSDPVEMGLLDEEGYFCDPQLGCANRLVAADVSTARSRQFSQEFRLSSDFDGPVNFHLGANFLRYDTVDKYYVFANTLTMYSALWGELSAFVDAEWIPGVSDNTRCLLNLQTVDPFDPEFDGCLYIDPNPIGSLNDNGRNYFLSKNPFRLISYAAFGEVNYNITPALKLTAGLRYTVDKKRAPTLPSWLLTGGYGAPVKGVVDQEWREPTGRVVLDWKPALSFTDETLLYASYAHGYKAGGANPPLPGGLPLGEVYGSGSAVDLIEALQPPEFGPEFVDAFELGAKNTLLDGRMTLNANAFYYDYEGYQISQIVNRSAINLNFDAEVWGAELEVDWRPLENLKLGFKGGWEKTRVGDGQSAVDMIDRTAGRTDWVVIKPFPTNPSNCVLPVSLLEFIIPIEPKFFSNEKPCTAAYLEGVDPLTHLPYVPNPTLIYGVNGGPPRPLPAKWAGYPGFDPSTAPNGGWGFSKDLGGNELPNAPDFTLTLTADYTVPLPNEWLMTLHADVYRQSEAWTRIYNEDPYDRLEPYTNVNLAAIFTNEDAGWRIMTYIKNVLDADNITGAFLNSDDTGLTTNVFLNEPRLYGLRVTKAWQGGSTLGSWLGSGGRRAGEPYPLTVELGAGALRVDAPAETYSPSFVDTFASPGMPFPVAVQEDDLDWGDSRSATVVFQPVGSAWKTSLGARFGRTNGVSYGERKERGPSGWLGPVNFQFPQLCGATCYREGPERFASAETHDREEFKIVDFTVGRDFGFGLTGRQGATTVRAGIRYAHMDSDTEVQLHGTPDYTIPAQLVFASPTTSLTMYHGRIEAERSFEGVGPVLGLEGSVQAFGDDESGHVGLDWALTGGVLFGRHKAAIEHAEDGYRYPGFRYYADGANGPSQRGMRLHVVDDEFSDGRSEDASVPVLGASLGLSYHLDAVRVSAGYSWERYFDALDGGIDEHVDADRTIDGPYFKIAVGFGG